MSWSIVTADSVTAQPWRNGGGITRELFAWTAGEDWIARVSVADIARDGPFSEFVGVDRWFAVLTGPGVLLGDPVVTVRCGGEVVNFAGESAPGCQLIDGETRDLNLMIRRDRAAGSLRRLPAGIASLAPAAAASAGDPMRGVFSVGGGVLQLQSGDNLVVPAMSLAWCAGSAASTGATFVPATGDPGNFELNCVARATEGRRA